MGWTRLDRAELTACEDVRADCVLATTGQTNAWLSSFAISVAVSIVVLQSLKAMMGGLLATVLSTVAVGSIVAALAVGADIAMH